MNWLYFVALRRTYLLYNQKEIFIFKYYEKNIPFTAITGVRHIDKSLVLDTSKGQVSLFIEAEEIREEIIAVVNKNTFLRA